MVNHMWTSDSFKQMNMKLFQAHSVAPLSNGQSNLEASCNSSRCNFGRCKKWSRSYWRCFLDWWWHNRCMELNETNSLHGNLCSMKCESVVVGIASFTADWLIDPLNFSRLACQFPSCCTWWCRAANQRNNTANLSCFKILADSDLGPT